MLDQLVQFVFSALLGLGLMVWIFLLARKQMIKDTKESADSARKEAGEAESRGASDGPNQG